MEGGDRRGEAEVNVAVRGQWREAALRALQTEGGARSPECRWPPGAGKGRKQFLPQNLLHLDFSLMRPIINSPSF